MFRPACAGTLPRLILMILGESEAVPRLLGSKAIGCRAALVDARQNACMRIRLRDGRHVGVEEHGTGVALIWLPGTPGSRVWKAPFIPEGVRLIVVERPGFGQSDPQPGRCYLDWPNDLAQVADQLGIDDFVLAGTSGAGPYLLAC